MLPTSASQVTYTSVRRIVLRLRSSVFFPAFVLWWMVFLAFLPALRNDFVNYDDDTYVVGNVHVLTGLTLRNISWAFGSVGAASNWHPITWLTHMADGQVFGVRSWGHHFTNVLLHATNAALLFVFLVTATRSVWRSFGAAALFGLHPLRVESVAWVAERKDLLSGLFFLLALWSYANWIGPQGLAQAREHAAGPQSEETGSSRKKWYGFTLIFFVLGLMSKPMVVTFPFVLLLLDYWPFQRLHADRFAALFIEKIPFFAFAGAACVMTYVAQSLGGAMSLHLPFASRAANAVISYIRYLAKLLWPAHLSVFYPFPESWPTWMVLWSLVAIVLGSGLVLVFARSHRYLLVGWFWFLGTLVPVLGLVQVGEQSMADRYSYIPSIGFFVILCWGISELLPAWLRQPKPMIMITGAIMVLCAIVTVRQIGFWKNSETLFRHALSLDPRNWMAHNNLGAALARAGDPASSIFHYSAAVQFRPQNGQLHNNLGVALDRAGRHDEAKEQYREATRLAPRFAGAHNNLGVALFREGRLDDAIQEFNAAISADPDYPDARINLGAALERAGRLAEALGVDQQVVARMPDNVAGRKNLAEALRRAGRLDESISQYLAAIERDPGNADLHAGVASALLGAGRVNDALAHFNEALRWQPESPVLHNNLGALLNRLGRPDEAIQHLKEAVRLKPEYFLAHVNLADALTNKGLLGEAAAEYRVALKLEPRSAAIHYRLGLVLLKMNERDEALSHFSAAVDVQPDFAEAKQQLLELTNSKAP